MVSENSRLFKIFENKINFYKKFNVTVFDILFDPDASQYIFKYDINNANNGNPIKIPTHRQWTIWSNQIKKMTGYSAVFHLQPIVDINHVENGITAILRNYFKSSVVAAYILKNIDSINILIDGIQAPPDTDVDKIRMAVKIFLSEISLVLGTIDFTSQSNQLPSKVEILDFVKILAPCSMDQLIAHLNVNHYHGLPPRWVSSQLDHLRKSGLILRRKDGSFILTFSGLSLLPRSKSRNSSDIQRALANTRRGC